jgi:signal transduction histidine kinase
MVGAMVAALRSARDHSGRSSPRRLPRRLSQWDPVIAGVFTVVVFATANNVRGWHLPGLLLLTVPLAWRRSSPAVAFLAQIAGIAVLGGNLPTAAFFAVMFGVYSVSAHSRSARVSLVVLLTTSAWVAVRFGNAIPTMPDWLTPFALVIPLWIMGLQVRRWRIAANAASAHAAMLEKAGELATQQAVAQEKARIAREMHDIVTHNVSVMVIQAAAARHVMDTEPESAYAAMAAVERVGQEAMADLRHIFDVLREPDGAHTTEPDLRPQASFDQLETLLTRVRGAGLDVSAISTGTPRPLPPAASLAAYRIVQESLTNVLRHARGSTAQVVLDYGDSALLIVVTNTAPCEPTPKPTSPGGRGLVGLAERVHAFNGEFDAAPRVAGGYRVRASLPWANL